MCSVKKQGNVYILTLINNDEHRLNPKLITSIRKALAEIKTQFTNSNSPPSALITTAKGKFFSNGYDLKWANSTPNYDGCMRTMDSLLRLLVRDLIEFPMPTIAAVNGHAAAAGLILAAVHDYVVMRGKRGFLYMSEVDIGLVVPEWFVAVVERRVGGGEWRGMRRVVLAAEKMTAVVGKEVGLVDVVAETVVETAVEIGEGVVRRGWDGWVYAENRKRLCKEVLGLIGGGGGGEGGLVGVEEVEGYEGVKATSKL